MSCLNRTVLHQLSRPIESHAVQLSLVDALHRVHTHRSVIFAQTPPASNTMLPLHQQEVFKFAFTLIFLFSTGLRLLHVPGASALHALRETNAVADGSVRFFERMKGDKLFFKRRQATRRATEFQARRRICQCVFCGGASLERALSHAQADDGGSLQGTRILLS